MLKNGWTIEIFWHRQVVLNSHLLPMGKNEFIRFDSLFDFNFSPWDFQNFLQPQCQYSRMPYPEWALRWVNIRKGFADFYGFRRSGVESMLRKLGFQFEGQPHSGLDDATNIARIAVQMIKVRDVRLFFFKVQKRRNFSLGWLCIDIEWWFTETWCSNANWRWWFYYFFVVIKWIIRFVSENNSNMIDRTDENDRCPKERTAVSCRL